MAENDDGTPTGDGGGQQHGSSQGGGSGGTQVSAEDVERMRKALKKANSEAETARKKLDELNDAGKSELEQAINAKKAAEARAETAERSLMRARIARSHGLADEDMEFVSGSSEDEIEESAKRLAGRILKPASDDAQQQQGGGQGGEGSQQQGAGGSSSQRPAENLRGGNGNPSEPPEETDPAKLAATIPRF